MSSRRSDGLLEGNDTILLNAASETILMDGLGDNIHGPLKNRLQSATEVVKPPEIRKSAASGLVCELNDDIDVGIAALVVPGSRSEQREADDSRRPKLL